MKMQTDFYSLSKNAPPNFFFLYSVIQSDCKKKKFIHTYFTRTKLITHIIIYFLRT